MISRREKINRRIDNLAVIVAISGAIWVLFITEAFGQAVISNSIPNGEWPNNPPGFVYDERVVYTNEYSFEIGFRVDSTKFDTSQSYSCNQWVPVGYWLYDRHPNNNDGRWMIGIGGNGTLCYQDQPRYNWGNGNFNLQFTITPDVCHVLTATRDTNGLLTVSLDGVTQSLTEYSGNVSYRGGANGVGVGREVNGYHSWNQADSFPGDIYRVVDNGNLIPLVASGVTGNASIGASICDGGPPPPPPPPPPTACELDPNGVECACETNPHPACNVCLID